MNEKPRLLLIYGGKGLESEVSLSGAENLYRYLKDSFNTVPVFIDKSGRWLTSKESLTGKSKLPRRDELTDKVSPINQGKAGLLFEDGSIAAADVAFPLLHGDFGEDGSVQGALETLGIPFFGCGTNESCICYDKICTKLIAEHLNIPTAKWTSAIDIDTSEAERRARSAVCYPMFVKPARLGSSFGASPVKNRKEFASAYESAKKLGGSRVLIEQLVKIDAELECVYFGAKGKELFTKIGEIRYKTDFYDYDTKYKSENAASVCARSSLEEIYGDAIRDYSRKLKEFIGIKDLCRFDFFLDSNGNILFNEINTIPGFTDSSLAPSLIEESGVDLATAFEAIISDRAKGI